MDPQKKSTRYRVRTKRDVIEAMHRDGWPIRVIASQVELTHEGVRYHLAQIEAAKGGE